MSHSLRLTRRAVLAGAGSLAFTELSALGRPGNRFPGPEEISRRLRQIASGAADRSQLRVVGRSAMGRPIEMLTIGSGPRSALVVGGPHANEPVGGATALELASRIARMPEAAGYSGYTWHIIGCIDPDGLALNSSWLAGDRSLHQYFLGFFRPAFEHQGEYSFPLVTNGYSFSAPTAENRAWQRALEMTRPSLQFGLHGSDYGGVFYLLSRDVPQLRAELIEEPAKFGLTQNLIGEPFADFPTIGPGVFRFLDIAAMVAVQQGRGQMSWKAGDSSAYFAEKRYGTFSVVCEVPAWDDGRLRNDHMSGFTVAEVLARHRVRLERLQAGALPQYERLRNLRASPSTQMLASGLEEFARVLPYQLAETRRLAPLFASRPPLSVREFAMYDTSLAFIGLRPLALLWRYARALSATHPYAVPLARSARAQLLSGIRDIAAEASLRAVPLEVMVGIQLNAIRSAAEAAI